MSRLREFAMLTILAFCGCNQKPMVKPEPQPTVRMFTATWCAACKRDEPRLERLARQGVRIEKIDVDANPELAGQFGVVSIPAYFLLDPATGNWSRTSIR